MALAATDCTTMDGTPSPTTTMTPPRGSSPCVPHVPRGSPWSLSMGYKRGTPIGAHVRPYTPVAHRSSPPRTGSRVHLHLGRSMRQRAPFATISTSQNKPDRSGYLRGVLHTLRQSVAPLGVHMAAAQSRRNLGVARCRQIQLYSEIAARLRSCHVAPQRCSRLTEHAKHSPEISGTAGLGLVC